MAQKQSLDWLRLDNAGKIYPATSTKKDTGVFRFSCLLKKPVEPQLLQRALESTLTQFPHFLCVMRRGLFWFYLEKRDMSVQVHEENRPICAPLYQNNRRSLLFDVSYYHCRINLETYHALCDGAGAIAFLQSLVYHYLLLAEPTRFCSAPPAPYGDVPIYRRWEDSFQKYYRGRPMQKRQLKARAYHLTGVRSGGVYQVIQASMPCSAVLRQAKAHQASLTVYLCALLMDAIHQDMPRMQEKRPVALTVPVNLRKHFPSDTARNFFGNITLSYCFAGQPGTLEDIIASLTRQMQQRLTPEELNNRLCRLAALERQPLLRFTPLFIKNPVLRIVRHIAERGESAVLSNVGPISMPEDMMPLIERMDVISSARRLVVCLDSFGDQLSLSLTSPFCETGVQRHFLRSLSAAGIAITIASNLTQ